jgi:TPR repeat protein
MTKEGSGVNGDIAEAVRLYTLASEQGHPGATFNLSVCYETGLGVGKDEEQAAKLCAWAAAQATRPPSITRRACIPLQSSCTSLQQTRVT